MIFTGKGGVAQEGKDFVYDDGDNVEIQKYLYVNGFVGDFGHG